MRSRKLIIYAILFFLTASYKVIAQPNTLYFLKGVPQTKDLNPARPGIERGFYVSMPLFSKLDLSVNTNNWSYNDLIHQGTGAQSDSLVWDFKKYLSAIGKNNFVMESSALTLLEFGYRRAKDFYGFSWTEHEFAEPFFTKSLVNLAYYGNTPYLGSTFHSGYFGIGAQHYREFAFTFSRELNKKISVGVTGKLLFGMSAIKTSGLNIVAGMPISGDQIDLGFSGKTYISAPVRLKMQSTSYRFAAVNTYDPNSYFTNFGNPGMAVDLGFTDKINKKFEFSMSLIDLGFIRWSTGLSTFSENGHFLYRGINVDDPLNKPPTTTDVYGLVKSLKDSLIAAFYPDTISRSFTTLLPVKIYFAGEYKVNQEITLGGVARVRIFDNMVHTSFTASANAKLTPKFSMSASYSIMESTFVNLGLAAAYRIGAVQLYAASDNVLSFIQPTTASNMNLRVGINLIFQDIAKQRKGVYHPKPARSAPGCPF
jgi:hypothetical protein